MVDDCPNMDNCCIGCGNDMSDGYMFSDDFEFGCCNHNGEADDPDA